MFSIALFAAAAAGFIALSYEIVWYRVVSFLTWSAPASFGVLLGFYLLGIALGSAGSRYFCRDEKAKGKLESLRPLAAFVFFANLIGFFVVPSIARAATTASPVMPLLAVAVAAGLLGAVLPLLSHFAIAPDDRAGQRLSYLYVANIIGSALGSLITGFVFMDELSLTRVSELLVVLGFAVAAALYAASRPGISRAGGVVAFSGAFAAVLLAAAPRTYDRVWERLYFKTTFKDQRFAEVVETKSGVIAVTRDGTVFGGGAYDGRLNTSIIHDRNGIVRAYAIGAMHPDPKEVIMIGLSSGSWAQVLANNPRIQHLTVIEINPGYLGIIAKYPGVASILKNPKVDIQIDDGRRWLLRHPERKADILVMNTSFHWRAHSTNLLSTEFMRLARAHLSPGGIFFFNTTSSDDVQKTAMTEFPYGLRMINFVAVSDSPFSLERDRFRDLLASYVIDGQPCIDSTTEDGRKLLEELSEIPDSIKLQPPQPWGLESRESILARTQDATIVTDDNMVVEFHKPLRFPAPEN
ncbi:MAG TPA: fused MFS/spermidine synthase [Polyangiaceae bacterium]|jgi:spermidine synthase